MEAVLVLTIDGQTEVQRVWVCEDHALWLAVWAEREGAKARFLAVTEARRSAALHS
jgi:hypothetical protein